MTLQRRKVLQAALLAPWLAAPWWQAASAREGVQPLVQHFGKALPPQPARVLAAGPPAAVLVAALAPQALLGWPTRLQQGASSQLSAHLAGLPVTGRLAGRGSTLGTEALLALRPEVIIDAGTVDDFYRSQAERMAAQTGIPYVLVDGRLPQSAQQLREVGALLGVSQRAEALAAYADATLAQAQQLRVRWQGQPPRVYLARGADGLETGWRGSINAELLEFAGLHNVAASGAEGNVGRVSLEQVLAWNPDLIVTQQAGLAAQLRADPLWRSVRAVQTGQVWQVPSLPFGWIDGPPGINRLMGLRWLNLALQAWPAPTLVPEQTAHHAAQVKAEAAAFNQLFYGSAGDAAWPEGSLP